MWMLAMSLMACTDTEQVTSQEAEARDGCVIGGCSGEICSDRAVGSACEWKEHFICYRSATCSRDVHGACAWAATGQLKTCLWATH